MAHPKEIICYKARGFLGRHRLSASDVRRVADRLIEIVEVQNQTVITYLIRFLRKLYMLIVSRY